MSTGTSSAIPAHLATLGHEATGGAERVLRTADDLHGALTAFARSDPPDAPLGVLMTIAGEVSTSALWSLTWADGVLDVATAFAVAGAGTTLTSKVSTTVDVDDEQVAALLSLPGGRVLGVEELAAMSPAEIRAWFQGMRTLGGFEDANFGAVEGLLFAVQQGQAGEGPFSIFAEPAFDLADALVLSTMQDGWLLSRGITAPELLRAPDGRPASSPDAADARAAAAAGWAGWFESYGSLPEERRDEVWALAEEVSVRAGEQLLAERGMGFGPGMMQLVPFTHSFRAAVATDREGELAQSLLETVDLEPLKDRAATVAGDWVAAAGRRAEEDARAELDRLHQLVPDPFDFVLWPLDTQVATTAESAAIAGRVLDTAIDILPVEVRGMNVGDLLARVGFDDDLDIVAELLVDPSATPPDIVQRFLDDMIGETPPQADPSGAYYLARLTDLGYLPGLSDGRPFPGAVPSIPTS